MSRANEDTKHSGYNARGKHVHGAGYQPMNHWVVCDSCGFDIRADDIRETWDGRLVCPSDWEPRHPQDFVRSKRDTIAAQGPVRPPTPDVFIKVGCPEDTPICGDAISGFAICGHGDQNEICRDVGEVPSGSFNPNTL
jgi:hypothetical protein